MGERLNLEIVNSNNIVLANAYYHWSGFTSSSLELAEIVVEEIIKDQEEHRNIISNAIYLLQKTGALLTEREIKAIVENGIEVDYINNSNEADRNNGLIGVSKKEIKDTQYWAEATVIVNLEDNKVSTSGCFSQIKEDELEEWGRTKEDFDKEIYKLDDLNFEEFKQLKETISMMIGERQYDFMHNDCYYTMIE